MIGERIPDDEGASLLCGYQSSLKKDVIDD